MSQLTDFFGLEFETDFSLFGDNFENLPGVYIIYTPKICLDVGQTSDLKTAIETHPNTRDWIKLSGDEAILVAFHFDDDLESREDKLLYLKTKLKPAIKAKN